MNKSLIALATVGALAAAPAAMAVDVGFGGEFDLAVEQVDNGGATNSKSSQMNNTHSRFWWDISDDLGTGLVVKGHLELDVGANGYHGGNTANNAAGSVCANASCNPAQGEVASIQSGINNRNSYIGLAGESWGEVRFGTQENVNEALGYAVDPFHGAAGPGGNIVNGMSQTGRGSSSNVFNGSNIGARRTDSTITYISPNWGGFTFQVDYALEGPTGTAGSNNEWTELFYGARYDGQFGNGGWRVYAAGADVSNGNLQGAGTGGLGFPGASSVNTSDKNMRFGGGLTFGSFAIDLILESNEWDSTGVVAGTGVGAFAGTKIERDGMWVGGSWMIPTGKLALGYLAMDDRDEASVTIASSSSAMIALGYYHTLSANSSLYFIYTDMDNDANAASNLQGVGAAADGNDPNQISLGMYLTF